MLKKPDERFRISFALIGILGLNLLLATGAGAVEAGEACESVDTRPVKIEAWMSKRQEPAFRFIRKELLKWGIAVSPYGFTPLKTFPG